MKKEEKRNSMFRIIKKQGNRIIAYRAGSGCRELEELIRQGRILRIDEDTYEVLTKEAVHGKGEVFHTGDYVKLDSDGWPYPNKKEFFERNHIRIGEHVYEQIQNELWAWDAEEEMCPEIEFLIREKGLEIREEDPERYFTAQLWGTRLSAAKDAVIVFYRIDRDEHGAMLDCDFNFIARRDFEAAYNILPEA